MAAGVNTRRIRAQLAQVFMTWSARLEPIPANEHPHHVELEVLRVAAGAADHAAAVSAVHEQVLSRLDARTVYMTLMLLAADVAHEQRLGRKSVLAWVNDRDFTLIVDGDAQGRRGS